MDFITSIFSIILKYREALISALLTTGGILFIVSLNGIFCGVLAALISKRFPKTIGLALQWASFLLSSIPVLVFLFWLHYPLQSSFDVVVDPFYTATLTLSLLNAFGVFEIVRNVMQRFPEHYRTAATVCGLSSFDTIWHIELPLMARAAVGPIMMLQVVMLHTSLFASLISVDELFRVVQRINAQVYKPLEIYTALGFFFLMLCLPINLMAMWLKNKFDYSVSER